jgi:ADP-ribosyl-[dinitrogen reductase] hydrolase
MAVRLAESLNECGKVDINDVAARYLDWWREGAFDMGPTAARVFALVDSGLTFAEASRQTHLEAGQQTAGCNPVHRSAPLAMIPDLDAQQLAESARVEARLTHHHPLAGDVAAAVVSACRGLVHGLHWRSAVEVAREGRLPETQAAMTSPDAATLNRGGFARDVLAAAVFFVQTNATFGAALDASLQFAGSANYCPVLVGSIGGARWGAEGIGDELLGHCRILPRVRSAAASLASRWPART